MHHLARLRVSRAGPQRGVARAGVAAGLALACLLVAAPAAAGQDAKIAQKALKVATKDALKVLKGEMSAAQSVLTAQIKVFDIGLKNDNYSAASLIDLGEALDSFQGGLVQDISDARASVAVAKSDALNVLFAAEGGFGPYPDGFSYADGGTLDAFAGQIDKLLAKSHGTLRKKLGKSRKLAAKAGIGFTFHLSAPSWISWDSNSGTSGIVPALTIDVMLAASAFDTQGDGSVVVAGTATFLPANPDITLFPAGSAGSLQDTPSLLSNRWLSVFQSVDEQSYLVQVQQGGVGGVVAQNLGVR